MCLVAVVAPVYSNRSVSYGLIYKGVHAHVEDKTVALLDRTASVGWFTRIRRQRKLNCISA